MNIHAASPRVFAVHRLVRFDVILPLALLVVTLFNDCILAQSPVEPAPRTTLIIFADKPMLMAAVAFWVAPKPLISLYTRDPRVLAVGPSLLWIAAAFQIFDGIQTVCTGALRGLGETRVPMFANLVGYWVLGLPLGFILCFVLKWGIYGMWIGLTLALIIISMTLLLRWRKDSAAFALTR